MQSIRLTRVMAVGGVAVISCAIAAEESRATATFPNAGDEGATPILTSASVRTTVAAPVAASIIQDLGSLANRQLGLRQSRIVDLDLPAIIDAGTSVLVELDGQLRHIDLWPHSIRSASYRLMAQVDGGSTVDMPAGPIRTIRGVVRDLPGSLVAGSLEPEGLYVTIRMADGRRLWIEPLQGRVPGIGCCQHVLYANEDVLDHGGTCGVDLLAHDVLHHGAIEIPGEETAGHPGAAAGVTDPIGGVAGGPATQFCVTEMACDADRDYYLDHGSSVSQVEARINLVTNVMNLQFETQVQITHEITGIIVRTTQPQIYTATDPSALLVQFRVVWTTSTGAESQIQRDVAQLFTGKNLDGSTIGIAQGIGMICNDFGAFCLVQSDFGGGLSCATDLSAHELGHLWAGTHCSCASPPSTMNPFITCANEFNAAQSVQQIINHRNSRTCLECGNPCTDQPTPPGQTSPLHASALTDVADDDNPQFAGNGAGDWVAVWSRKNSAGGPLGTDADIIVSRSSDNGISWTTPVAMASYATSDSGDDREPVVVTDGKGLWIAAWYASNTPAGAPSADQDLLYSRSLDNGQTWSAPARLNTNGAGDSGDDRGVWLAVDSSGRWIAAWYSNDSLGGTIGTDMDILHAWSDNGGLTWSAPAPLNANAAADAGADVRPMLATDGRSLWLAVWTSNDALGSTIGADDDILFARSTDGGVTWSLPLALNTNAVTDAGSDLAPFVATDGQGRWIAVWYSTENLGGFIETDADIFVARSADDGQTWSEPLTLNANAASDFGQDLLPEVAYDGAGGWLAVWSTDDSLSGQVGTDDDIVFARSTVDGVKWSRPLWLNADAELDLRVDLRPHLARDESGNWRVIWYNSGAPAAPTGTDHDVFLARFTLPAYLDCNDNGRTDECDIAQGDSDDADADGIPDECQIKFVLGDLNGDGHVNGLDLAILLGQWSGSAQYRPCPPHAPADLNQDCRVNGLDVAVLLGNWG